MQNLIKNVRSAVFRILCTYIHFCRDSAGCRIVPFPQCLEYVTTYKYPGAVPEETLETTAFSFVFWEKGDLGGNSSWIHGLEEKL
jgi:hypothetical protein